MFCSTTKIEDSSIVNRNSLQNLQLCAFKTFLGSPSKKKACQQKKFINYILGLNTPPLFESLKLSLDIELALISFSIHGTCLSHRKEENHFQLCKLVL